MMRCKFHLAIIFLFIIGCAADQFTDIDKQMMPRKVAGTADSQVIMLQEKLAQRGVKIITLGQDYLISIPSALLFADQSPNLTWDSYDILNGSVAFLKQFKKITIHVTSYSIRYRAVRREKALTLARANAVANYLWSQGIDSRLIFAQGAGSEKPIIAFPDGGDHSINSRIEITFRDTTL